MSNAIRPFVNVLAVIARVFFGAAFIFPAFNTIFHWQIALNSMEGMVESHFILGLIVALQLLGGVLVIFSVWVRVGALILLLALVVMTWVEMLAPVTSSSYNAVIVSFMRLVDNVGLAGGAIYIICFGAKLEKNSKNE